MNIFVHVLVTGWVSLGLEWQHHSQCAWLTLANNSKSFTKEVAQVHRPPGIDENCCSTLCCHDNAIVWHFWQLGKCEMIDLYGFSSFCIPLLCPISLHSIDNYLGLYYTYIIFFPPTEYKLDEKKDCVCLLCRSCSLLLSVWPKQRKSNDK